MQKGLCYQVLCLSHWKVGGDEEHELEKKKKYTSYTSTCKSIVVSLKSEKKDKLICKISVWPLIGM